MEIEIMEYGLILTMAAFVLTSCLVVCGLMHCCLFITSNDCFSIAQHTANTHTIPLTLYDSYTIMHILPHTHTHTHTHTLTHTQHVDAPYPRP